MTKQAKSCTHVRENRHGFISVFAIAALAGGCSSQPPLVPNPAVANSDTQVARERLRDAQARPKNNGNVAIMRHSVYEAQREAVEQQQQDAPDVTLDESMAADEANTERDDRPAN